MKTFFRNHKKFAAVIVVGLLLVGWWFSVSARGYFGARFDVARGHYEVQSMGLRFAWSSNYAHLLRERYGIEDRVVAGCVVSESLRSYVNAYNEVTWAAAKRKFGRD